jgi:triosephosphate isomerase
MPSARMKIVVGNWKMNPDYVEEAKRIIRETRKIASKLIRTSVVVCPPFTFIPNALKSRDPKVISVGAQDIHPEERGAFTGSVSALMLKDMGVDYVIIGHSERRKAGDTNEIISQKVKTALESGLSAILCVGEDVHDADGGYLDTLKQQIKSSLAGVPKKLVKKLVIAYEPVWAIGAKTAMEPATVNEMAIFVRKVLADTFGQDSVMSTPILYGGSVNFRNAGDIVTKGGVDGLLVGRESVNPPGFSELLKAVDGANS